MEQNVADQRHVILEKRIEDLEKELERVTNLLPGWIRYGKPLQPGYIPSEAPPQAAPADSEKNSDAERP